uniref:G domain-containing protein n=2 Tax=Panagrolaimus sp. PS1159 TaxID=55785 RepID=A0AC35GCV1_9BILA
MMQQMSLQQQQQNCAQTPTSSNALNAQNGDAVSVTSSLSKSSAIHHNDRDHKTKIVFFNLKEPYGTSEDRYANDLQNVNEIFKVMGVSPNIVKIIRLGHFTSQGRPRRVLPQKLKPKKTKKSKSTVSPNPFINFATKDNESTDKKEINILVIGETGVGKSTWINGIANYMNFDTFDNALAAKKPICLIPMNFNLYVGEKYEKVTVNMKSTVGERDKNEAEASTGQSCTQEPKVYRYITDTVVFNLIDTPGIGDTRGIEYDIENMKMVLKCLSNWEKIHGICILLKPNVPRLTLSLRYCIEELLVNLHKNSIPNISVIFTNSCSTLFKPGDTMTVLKKLFEDIKSSSGNIIQLSGANIFCIDNEAVRLLYAHQKGVEVEKVHIKNCSTSWTRTVEETYRLFEYITKLSPHSSFETKATSQIRGTLDELSAILADKNDGVVQNKKAFEQQNQLLKMLKDNLVEKQKSTTFQAEHVQKVSLNYPITVCCGPNCIETIRIPNCEKQETFYKKICCPQCPLRNVNGGQIGESNLRQCTAFGSNGFCQSCGCSWQSHMQIRYYQRKTIGNFLSSVDHEEINHLNLQITAKSNYILQQKANLHHLQQRYSIIAALTQPFFEFLRHNSIIPFNSALEEYLEFSIEEREKILKPEDGRFKIESLQKLLAIHQQQKCFADCKDKLALRAANSSTQKITLLNYAQKITMLKNNELIGEELDASNIYQKLFETSEFKVIEILTKIELNNNAADKSQENGSLSKKKKQKSAT